VGQYTLVHLGIVEKHWWWILELRGTFGVVCRWRNIRLLINPGWILLVVFQLAARLVTIKSTACAIFTSTGNAFFWVKSSQRLLCTLIRCLTVNRLMRLNVIETNSWCRISLGLSRHDHLLAWGACTVCHGLPHKGSCHDGLGWIWGERMNGCVWSQAIVVVLNLAN